MGVLLLFNGAFMLISSLVSLLYQDGQTFSLFMAAAFTLTVGIGFVLIINRRNHTKQLNKREGYLVVSLGWLLMTLSGMLPYLLTGVFSEASSAFFETMSGYTTTGSSVLADIQVVPKGVLFWRSTTHWIGGMGIIVLAIAILPLLGIGGMQLTAEAPGPSSDKLHPRITDTAKRLWFIYLSFTLVETLLLWLAGMNFFDAINHAMSTVSTGGFSTKNASVAYWNDQPLIQYIIICFMFLAGINFVLSYFALTGKIKKVFQDEEFRFYSRMIIQLLSWLELFYFFDADLEAVNSFEHPSVFQKIESSFRHAFFQVIAVITTTGFATSDFTLGHPCSLTLFFWFNVLWRFCWFNLWWN